MVGYIRKRFTCPQTVTHRGSNHLIATRPGVEPVISPSLVQRPNRHATKRTPLGEIAERKEKKGRGRSNHSRANESGYGLELDSVSCLYDNIDWYKVLVTRSCVEVDCRQFKNKSASSSPGKHRLPLLRGSCRSRRCQSQNAGGKRLPAN